MTQVGGKAENQHYVPKMLLRRFAIDPSVKDPQVYVFDKREHKKFPTAIKNVAAERGFYDLKRGDPSLSIEPLLTELEGHAAAALDKIRAASRVSVLSPGDLWWLATFVATQRVRARGFREAMLQFEKDLVKRVEAIGFDPAKMEKRPRTPEDIKLATIANLFNNVSRIAPILVEFDWVLFTTARERPFYISDNPLTMHNSLDNSIYGGIGFASRGVEVYLPIAPTMMLGMWCPSIRAEGVKVLATGKQVLAFQAAEDALRDGRAETLSSSIERAHERASVEERMVRTAATVRALQERGAIECTATNVDFLNAEQVTWAERFVMSSSDDFSLAERVVTDAPQTRAGGPRLRLEPLFKE